MSDSNRLLAVLNIAMADTAITIWSGKRFYGAHSERGDVAAGDRDPAGRHRRQSGHGAGSGLAAARQHAVAPGIPCRASQPQRGGGDGPPQPLRRRQTFTLTTPDSRAARTPASRRRARTVTTPGSGAACTTRARSTQRRRRRGDRQLRQSTLHAAASRPAMTTRIDANDVTDRQSGIGTHCHNRNRRPFAKLGWPGASRHHP